MALVKKCLRSECTSRVLPPEAEMCDNDHGSMLLQLIDDPAFSVCSQCRAVQAADAAQCANCGHLLKRVARLRFPWGEELLLAAGTNLLIGRNGRFAPPELANRLAPPQYRTVSQRHAEIFWQGDQLMLRDANSTNGTFLDDVRLPPGGQAAIVGNRRIRLSSRLEIGISLSD